MRRCLGLERWLVWAGLSLMAPGMWMWGQAPAGVDEQRPNAVASPAVTARAETLVSGLVRRDGRAVVLTLPARGSTLR